MKLGSLTVSDLEARLRRGITLASGVFTFRLQGTNSILRDSLHLLYADHPVLPPSAFEDFVVALRPPNWLRRHIRPQQLFLFDGFAPFFPLPANQAFASFEWGLNWVISNHAHQFLMLHAAVLEKEGHALVMPGEPGSGKSTLCAALMLSGWRLLSDELTLIAPGTRMAYPICRPISLKNASIEVIGGRFSGATLGPVVDATSKGRVTHLKPTLDSIEQMSLPAPITWFVFPRYEKDSATVLTPRSRAESFLEVGKNAFNYSFHAQQGFTTMADVISNAECFDLKYSDLDEGIDTLSNLPKPEILQPSMEHLPA